MRDGYLESKKLWFDTEEEWLAWKEGKIGSSTSGAVAGMNKHSTPINVWERMTGRISKIEQTEEMVFGIYGEDLVRKVFKHYHPKVEFQRDLNKILGVQSTEYEFIQTTPDDEVWFEDELMNCEIKTTNFYSLPEEVPDYIIAQCHHQMSLTHHSKTLLIWINVITRKHNYMVIDFNPDFAMILNEAIINFHDLVVNDIMPPPTNLADYSKTEAVEGEIQADDDIVKHYYKLYELNEQSKDVKSKIDWHKLKIATFMKENTVIKSDDVKLVTYNVQTRKSVDTKKLKEEGLYDDYSKESSSRVMKINYKSVDKL